MQRKPTVIVVGSGLSGCMSALRAHEAGASVTLISSSIPARSCFSCFKDGMNLFPLSPDSLDDFASESVSASGQLMSDERARFVASHASHAHVLLQKLGVNFAMTADGAMQRYRTFGSDHKRAGHLGTKLSKSILSSLYGQLMMLSRSSHAELKFGVEFLSLITAAEGECAGVVALDMSDMKVKSFLGDAVIMCTGGYHGIFADSTASLYCDGSPLYSCYEAGASLSDLEMIQYHPFCIKLNSKFVALPEIIFSGNSKGEIGGDNKKTFTIEDGRIFGIGAFKESASADIAAKFNGGKIKRGARCTLKFEDVSSAFSGFAGAAIADIEQITGRSFFDDEFEVYPAACRSLGGIAVDLDFHSSLEGLFSAGTAACSESAGVLGGNEILMSIGSSLIAGRRAAEYAKRVSGTRGDVKNSTVEDAVRKEEDVLSEIRSVAEGAAYADVVRSFKNDMSEFAGILKNADSLNELKKRVEQFKLDADVIAPSDYSEQNNHELISIYKLKKSISLALLYIESALARKESRGAHVRIDEPSTQKTAQHSVVSLGGCVEMKQKTI